MTVRFRGTLELRGKTATGLRVPPDVVEALGGGNRPAVRVTINGHTYRSSIAVMDRTHGLGVSAEVRAAAGVAAGDVFDVVIELDTQPRTVAIPADLATALAAAPQASAFFEKLPYSQKQWYVLGINGAKTAGTRERRVAKAIERLRAGRGAR